MRFENIIGRPIRKSLKDFILYFQGVSERCWLLYNTDSNRAVCILLLKKNWKKCMCRVDTSHSFSEKSLNFPSCLQVVRSRMFVMTLTAKLTFFLILLIVGDKNQHRVNNCKENRSMREFHVGKEISCPSISGTNHCKKNRATV